MGPEEPTTEQADKPLGVMLINLGTPDSPTAPAIRRYLAEFLRDPRVVSIPRLVWLPILYGFILPLRPRKLIPNYSSIWGETKGPIRYITESLAEKTQQAIAASNTQRKTLVRAAMTYGNPSIADVYDELCAEGISDLMLIPMFPQYSASTNAAVFDKFAKLIGQRKCIPNLSFIAEYHVHPSYIEVAAISIKQALIERPNDHLLFSFHGLPEAQAEAGDPYPEQCLATAAAIISQLGLTEDQYDITFQSRFGPAEWLKPYTSTRLAELPKAGKKNISVVCPGFAADCLETLEEIEVENRNVFIAAGGESFNYIPALNDSSHHVSLMQQLINERYPA